MKLHLRDYTSLNRVAAPVVYLPPLVDCRLLAASNHVRAAALVHDHDYNLCPALDTYQARKFWFASAIHRDSLSLHSNPVCPAVGLTSCR